jgi:hypothetical protein
MSCKKQYEQAKGGYNKHKARVDEHEEGRQKLLLFVGVIYWVSLFMVLKRSSKIVIE